jgi:hypothetical protein
LERAAFGGAKAKPGTVPYQPPASSRQDAGGRGNRPALAGARLFQACRKTPADYDARRRRKAEADRNVNEPFNERRPCTEYSHSMEAAFVGW